MHRRLRQACFEEKPPWKASTSPPPRNCPPPRSGTSPPYAGCTPASPSSSTVRSASGKPHRAGAENPVSYATWAYSRIRPPSRSRRSTPDIRAYCGRMRASSGRFVLQRPVRPMKVAMVYVLAEDQQQVPLAGDQHPVQAFAAGTGDPASGYSVRARRLPRKRSRAGSGGESSRPRYRHRPTPRQRPR